MFHLELRQFPHVARAFNLSREELDARFARPWANGAVIEYDDRRWAPERARLTDLRGARASARARSGWAAAGRRWARPHARSPRPCWPRPSGARAPVPPYTTFTAHPGGGGGHADELRRGHGAGRWRVPAVACQRAAGAGRAGGVGDAPPRPARCSPAAASGAGLRLAADPAELVDVGGRRRVRAAARVPAADRGAGQATTSAIIRSRSAWEANRNRPTRSRPSTSWTSSSRWGTSSSGRSPSSAPSRSTLRVSRRASTW